MASAARKDFERFGCLDALSRRCFGIAVDSDGKGFGHQHYRLYTVGTQPNCARDRKSEAPRQMRVGLLLVAGAFPCPGGDGADRLCIQSFGRVSRRHCWKVWRGQYAARFAVGVDSGESSGFPIFLRENTRSDPRRGCSRRDAARSKHPAGSAEGLGRNPFEDSVRKRTRFASEGATSC